MEARGEWELSFEEWRELQRRLSMGQVFEEIAGAIGCSARTIQRFLRRTGGVPQVRSRSPLRLSQEEREEISRALRAGDSFRAIAARMGRAASTISREVKWNGGRSGYRAWRGERSSARRARRPKPAKLAVHTRLRREVELRLAQRWSPQQIARRLRWDYPGDLEMRVSHETIYQSLYVQTRGALRRELAAYLRTKRQERRPKKRKTPAGAGRMRDMVMISDRPKVVETRMVPGHWEGDLIVGKDRRSAIGTLVERTSRYVVLVHLPDGHTADVFRRALARKFRRFPAELRRTLTWDQGKEMAQHVRFTMDTNIEVYFCDPHSPWQRGSNENTNGLLRQYFPKGQDLTQYSAADLVAVARELNNRPRQTLSWLKPVEVLASAVASTR